MFGFSLPTTPPEPGPGDETCCVECDDGIADVDGCRAVCRECGAVFEPYFNEPDGGDFDPW